MNWVLYGFLVLLTLSFSFRFFLVLCSTCWSASWSGVQFPSLTRWMKESLMSVQVYHYTCCFLFSSFSLLFSSFLFSLSLFFLKFLFFSSCLLFLKGTKFTALNAISVAILSRCLVCSSICCDSFSWWYSFLLLCLSIKNRLSFCVLLLIILWKIMILPLLCMFLSFLNDIFSTQFFLVLFFFDTSIELVHTILPSFSFSLPLWK